MKIGAKLLVTYLVIIGVVALLIGVSLPRFVERTVRDVEQQRLNELVTKQAAFISDRVNRSVKGDRPGLGAVAARQAATLVEEMLTDETMFLIDDNCVVVRSSRPQLVGQRLGDICQTANLKALRRRSMNAEGLEPMPIVAVAPLDVSVIKGYSLGMVRSLTYIQDMSKPITRRLFLVVLMGIAVSMVIALALSREMVRRLRAAGTAARALAEGDLNTRVPESGNDEITELAGHFNHMADRIQALVEGLRRSEQARKELLVTVSHELRTPMTSIAGFAEALRDGVVPDEPRKQRYYAIIASESARLTRLINDLFDVAKLDAGQLELRLQAMVVGPWLAEAAESLRPLAEQAGARLELQVSTEAQGARMYGDRDRLDQVVTNLAGNAIRFTPPGERVTLGARVEGDEVVVEVADRGPGIGADEVGHVFDRFFQGKNKGAQHKGAGLGLAIVKSLVEAHGGRVGVSTAPGQGATFWFRLKRL